MTAQKESYIGDSVYCEFDGYSLQIYTNNGLGRENVIYLEPEVVAGLMKYLEKCNIIKG